MKQQPLFAVSHLTRTDAFSVSTYVEQHGAKRFVVKRPNLDAAKPHLANMVHTHDRLAALQGLAKLITPAPIEAQQDGSVRFPYIEGKGVERLLITSILEKRADDALAIINKLLAVIDSLPSEKRNPCDDPHFTKVFGKLYDRKVDCVLPGVIDLNLDNIIQDAKGNWHLIDYEWAFDFALPKALIKQRFFYWFFVHRYRTMLSYHAERIEQVNLGPETAVPVYIYKAYPWAFEDFSQVVAAESNFQQYVTGNATPLAPVALFEDPAERTPTVKPASLIREYFARGEQVHELGTQLQAEQAHIQALTAQLERIHSSRTYRTIRKVYGVKQKVAGKLKKRG